MKLKVRGAGGNFLVRYARMKYGRLVIYFLPYFSEKDRILPERIEDLDILFICGI
jgi:hypothetical protein